MLSTIGFQLKLHQLLSHYGFNSTDLSSLFTKSPKPGVSTTVSFKRTPFSSISVQPLSAFKSSLITRRCQATTSQLTSTGGFNLYRPASICAWRWDLLGMVELGLEEGIDQGGFAETGLAWEGRSVIFVREKRSKRVNSPTTMATN